MIVAQFADTYVLNSIVDELDPGRTTDTEDFEVESIVGVRISVSGLENMSNIFDN
jgi:hypothetical protein